MPIRFAFLTLETRDNPSGPDLIDPIGILTPNPSTVATTTPAPTTGTVSGPTIDPVLRKIIDTTLAVLAPGW